LNHFFLYRSVPPFFSKKKEVKMLFYDRWLFKSAAIMLIIFAPWVTRQGRAASSAEIDAKANATLRAFYSKVDYGKRLADQASGILIFPSVLKAGLWVGGQYGEGALRVRGNNIDYYNIVGASLGLQFGAQTKSVILLFMTDESLSAFRSSEGWEAGVDGSVAFAEMGVGGAIDTHTLQRPIIGFVFNNRGLMVDVSLKGTKITQIVR
jgi:lipid-binding SYLF domain-containing protein